MKRTALTALAVVMTIAAPAAYAQPGRGYDHDRHAFHRHDEWRRGYHMRHDDWARGRHLDWRARHLRRPPRGYEWREVDGNYVLGAVATGIIASVIANSR